MNRIFGNAIVMLLALLCILSACKKETNKPELVVNAEAKAEHNGKSGGVYKGVLIGSTGTIKIVLQDGKLEVIVTIDGETRTLTTTGLTGWTSGQSITQVDFSNGNWSVKFSVDGNGNNPRIVPNIAGHIGMVVLIVKESSTQVIKLYEGRFNGTGVSPSYNHWNFISNANHLYGIHSDGVGVKEFVGQINGVNLNGLTSAGASFSGSFNGELVSGEWQGVGVAGTWQGERKL